MVYTVYRDGGGDNMTKKELYRVGEMMSKNFVNGASWNYKDEEITNIMFQKVKDLNFSRFKEILIQKIGTDIYAPPLMTIVNDFLVEESIRKQRK